MEGLTYKIMIILKALVFCIFFVFTLGKYDWNHYNEWWEKNSTDVLTTTTGTTLGIIDGVQKQSEHLFTTSDLHDIVMVAIKAIVGGFCAFMIGKVMKYFDNKDTKNESK